MYRGNQCRYKVLKIVFGHRCRLWDIEDCTAFVRESEFQDPGSICRLGGSRKLSIGVILFDDLMEQLKSRSEQNLMFFRESLFPYRTQVTIESNQDFFPCCGKI